MIYDNGASQKGKGLHWQFKRIKQQLLSLIHISEPTRLGMISYAVFCLKKKKKKDTYIVCRLLLDKKKKE